MRRVAKIVGAFCGVALVWQLGVCGLGGFEKVGTS